MPYKIYDKITTQTILGIITGNDAAATPVLVPSSDEKRHSRLKFSGTTELNITDFSKKAQKHGKLT